MIFYKFVSISFLLGCCLAVGCDEKLPGKTKQRGQLVLCSDYNNSLSSDVMQFIQEDCSLQANKSGFCQTYPELQINKKKKKKKNSAIHRSSK